MYQLNDQCQIRHLKAEDLNHVLSWRNHPDIRRYMLSQQEITADEHYRWFERASNDPAKKLLIVEENALALGFVQFSGVSKDAIADWGFYAVPSAPKGTGRKLGIAALNCAFDFLQLHKVCGQALSFNTASIHLHQTLGFQQEGILRDQHRIDGVYQDLICFGLLRHEWRLNDIKITD